MKVLIIGGGGREHAMAWQIAQSPHITQLFVAPGNAGTQLETKVDNVNIDSNDIPALIDFAKKQAITLTIVGPEAPLATGIVDQFEGAHLACFGPTRAAAQLESSKAYSKDFMKRHAIPSADYQSFTAYEAAAHYISQQNMPIVIKADGLAAGKGVVIAHSEHEALQTARQFLAGECLSGAGHQIVVEEYLVGEEASFIAVCDGEHVLALASSQDHKARDNNDQGPNTGGMGAYSPAPCVSAELHERIMQEVMYPTVQGLAAEGISYRGFLYAGLMLLPDGQLRVLEFNCRLGDPETQVLMLRLKSNLAEICSAAMRSELDRIALQWDPRTALGVVMAAGGYPQQYDTGDVITGLEQIQGPHIKVFHAGTKLTADQQVLTQGGRVLCVTALGDNVQQAQQQAYAAVHKVQWRNAYYRTDIGYRALSV